MDPLIILNLVSTIAIVCSMVFAGLEVRHAQQQRSRQASLRFMESIVSADFVQAMRLVLSMPVGLSRVEFEQRLGEATDALTFFLGTCESLGLLVFRHEIKLDLVDEMLPLVPCWARLSRYIEDYRAEVDRPTMWEWMQWLVERLEQRESKRPRQPAFLAHRSWHE